MGKKYKPSGDDQHAVLYDLERYRRLRQSVGPIEIAYLSDREQNLASLKELIYPSILSVHSLRLYRNLLASHTPGLIFLESHLEWSPEVLPIEELARFYQVPVVLICEAHQTTDLDIERAFKMGISDTLHAPIDLRELESAINALVKYQKVVHSWQ